MDYQEAIKDIENNIMPSVGGKSLKIGVEAIKKLTVYENLEKQGRTIKLPCREGDTAYFIHRGEIHEDKIKTISLEFGEDYLSIWLEPDNADILFNLDKNVFLTKEEAEAKLKKGKWIRARLLYYKGVKGIFGRCSVCGVLNQETNFCPSCGADMRETQND